MTQKDKELLLKDLSCRIPYGVIVNINGISNVKLTSVSWFGEIGVDDGSAYLYTISEIKPYLLPLSSMTEEQYAKFIIISGWDGDIEDIRRGKFSCIGYIGLDYIYDTIDWFNKHHFDYRGLIPMGLAKDASGLNIY